MPQTVNEIEKKEEINHLETALEMSAVDLKLYKILKMEKKKNCLIQ